MLFGKRIVVVLPAYNAELTLRQTSVGYPVDGEARRRVCTGTMRRTMLVATLAVGAGLCLASATAFASTRLNIWRTYGEYFQLGYVVGYLDAVVLAQRHDIRAQILSGGAQDFNRWVREVNAFYEDPKNAERPVPDAMHAVGMRIGGEWLQELARKQQQGKPSPSPSPES
jgi:hypothetical protein